MTDKKFTQEQIIKALECCTKDTKDCYDCPLQNKWSCDKVLSKNVLDLINRLKTRIVRYQLKNTNQRNALASLNKKVAEQKARLGVYETCNARKDEAIRHLEAEIERLKDYNENLLTANTALSNEILDIKTEAIKEFAERLCKDRVSNDPVVIAVKAELKEMTEVDK